MKQLNKTIMYSLYAALFTLTNSTYCDEGAETREVVQTPIESAAKEWDMQIYLETHLGSGPGSDYVLLLPKNLYALKRQVVDHDSVVFSYTQDEDKPCPYQSNSGFILVRTNSEDILQRGTEETFRNVKKFLEEQSIWGSVFFLDHKFISSSESLTQCQGRLYRSGMGEGRFFLQRRKPSHDGYHSGSSQACYLLFYTFEEDHEHAEQQFQEISRCLYQVEEGQLVSSQD